VVAACLTLASELHAGAPTTRALAAVAADWPDLFGTAAGAAASGGDVPAAFRVAAEQPGAAAVRALAAGWEVTERTGAPLANVVTTVGAALRADEAVRREAHSQLATARTTARLLAVLPVGTLLLLSGGDGEAFRFLLGSPYGWACVGAAGLFVAAGLSWVGRLARSATRSTWE
jgi:tight adherence protein B